MPVRRGKSDDVAPFDQVGALPRAANLRLLEAQTLARAKLYAGAIYLAGYAAEMWLKYGCYRLGGYADSDRVRKEDRARLVTIGIQNGIEVGQHELIGWSRLLTALKDGRTHRPLPEAQRGRLQGLVAKAKAITEYWDVDMRYRPRQYTEAQWSRVHEAVREIESAVPTLARK